MAICLTASACVHDYRGLRNQVTAFAERKIVDTWIWEEITAGDVCLRILIPRLSDEVSGLEVIYRIKEKELRAHDDVVVDVEESGDLGTYLCTQVVIGQDHVVTGSLDQAVECI